MKTKIELTASAGRMPRLVRLLLRRMCSHEWELEDADKWDTRGAGIHAQDHCTKCGGQRTLFIFAGTITESKIHWPNAESIHPESKS